VTNKIERRLFLWRFLRFADTPLAPVPSPLQATLWSTTQQWVDFCRDPSIIIDCPIGHPCFMKFYQALSQYLWQKYSQTAPIFLGHSFSDAFCTAESPGTVGLGPDSVVWTVNRFMLLWSGRLIDHFNYLDRAHLSPKKIFSRSAHEIMDDTASVKSASPAGTTASAGTKRKRAAEPKFYAVRVGNHPGIYHTWADCLEQVKGFKKATCTL